MLYIAFHKLMRSTQQQLLTYALRFGMDERHYILQLITETEATALILQTATYYHRVISFYTTDWVDSHETGASTS